MQKINRKSLNNKLLNNTNFSYDCRDNSNKCTFEPICVEIREITCTKKCYNLFEKEVSKFANSSLIEKKIEKILNEKMLEIKKDNPFRNGRIAFLNNEILQNQDALEHFKSKEKKLYQEKSIKNIETRLEEGCQNNSTSYERKNANVC